ncbi:MAG: hypothetical protein ACRDF4_06375 [Rhabdochlamydiaceae bacterium]
MTTAVRFKQFYARFKSSEKADAFIQELNTLCDEYEKDGSSFDFDYDYE